MLVRLKHLRHGRAGTRGKSRSGHLMRTRPPLLERDIQGKITQVCGRENPTFLNVEQWRDRVMSI